MHYKMFRKFYRKCKEILLHLFNNNLLKICDDFRQILQIK